MSDIVGIAGAQIAAGQRVIIDPKRGLIIPAPPVVMPQRIQLRRTKGWRKPDGAIVVSRPTRWGNPFTVMNGHRQGWLVWDDRDRLGLAPAGQTTSDGFIASWPTRELAAKDAVKRYRRWLTSSVARVCDLTPLLHGHDLACWCPLDLPCHADVLLELANRGA